VSQQELLDYCIEMQQRGDRYETIAVYLKRQNADEITTKVIFRELDRIEKINRAAQSTKLPISWSRLVAGFLFTCLGLYYLTLTLKSGRLSITLTVIGIIGLAIFLGECIKLIINFTRK
jgi:hypothetical protein